MNPHVKNLSRALAALAVGLGALSLAACDVAQAGVNGGVLTGTQGKVELALAPQHLVSEGKNDFSMTIVDLRTHKTVTGASVTLHTTMPAMGHQTNEGTVEEPTPGTYLVRGVLFDMPGDWAVRVQVKRDALTDEVEFPFNVP